MKGFSDDMLEGFGTGLESRDGISTDMSSQALNTPVVLPSKEDCYDHLHDHQVEC